MNKSPSIFQEIESKLAKDHYASRLPAYHPAKGKGTLKEPKAVYQSSKPVDQAGKAGDGVASNGNDPNAPFPESPPKLIRPGNGRFHNPASRKMILGEISQLQTHLIRRKRKYLSRIQNLIGTPTGRITGNNRF